MQRLHTITSSSLIRRYATTIATPNVYTAVGVATAATKQSSITTETTAESKDLKEGFYSVRSVRIDMNSLVENYHNQQANTSTSSTQHAQSKKV